MEWVVVVLTGAPALLLACPLITCRPGQSVRKVWRHCKYGTLVPISTLRIKLFHCSHTDPGRSTILLRKPCASPNMLAWPLCPL